jgi:hypothetical protein
MNEEDHESSEVTQSDCLRGVVWVIANEHDLREAANATERADCRDRRQT